MNQKVIGLFLTVFMGISSTAFADLVVYTDRPAARFAKVSAELKNKTGETVTFVEASFQDLVKRLELEGADSSADLILTKDLVYFADLQKKGFLKSFQETDAVKKVAPFMRGTNNEWVTVSFRVRSVVYSPNVVDPSELTTYKDLADPKWAGRLCLRTGKAAYNEALIAGLIAADGLEQTKATVQGWLSNLAEPVFASDNLVIEAIANGTCDIGIVNHYYLAGFHAKTPNYPVKMAFLNQNEGGVFTNGTGAALLKTSKNTANAQEFLDLLLKDDNQLEISSAHMDYPAVQGLAPNTLIKDWGSFKMNETSWDQLGTLVPQAKELINEVGYQ